MAMSTAFYAPDLTAHVAKLKEAGEAYLPFSYTNPADGATMWAIMITVPTSGTMLEVHSAVLAEDYQADFSALSETATSAASTASPVAASAGHSASASSPLPGISMPTTSIHSGAARASSANAAVEPPAYARQ